MRDLLKPYRGALSGVALMSGVSNLLMLTGSLFMLQVYDRVIPSRSVPTLVALALLAGGLFCFQGLLDLIRSRVLVRIGMTLDKALGRKLYAAGPAALRDLDTVRGFLSGLGPIALCDLPWMPLYLGLCFAFHFWIGVTALAGALLLVALTLWTEAASRAPTRQALALGEVRNTLAETGRRNAESIAVLGMSERLAARWSAANDDYLAAHRRLSDVAGGFGTVAKVLRTMLQSAVLAVGAWLVIHQEATAGVIIAGSILSARALAPIDLAIAHWRGFVAARQSWQRLKERTAPEGSQPMPLPRPTESLAVEQACVAPPGADRLTVADLSLTLKAGQALGVVGPSASGKSSLARMLVGAWPAIRGRVRLDGAALDQWQAEALGRDIGYLAQEVELMAGTVGENIARFDPAADPKAMIAAARAAGVHELIVGLPMGYRTEIGEQGRLLSAGQRQRIALARALYGDPFLVVLDEPNANLDEAGEAALTLAIQGVRARGGIAVVIAHRPSALAAVDHLLVMNQGRAQAFGPKRPQLVAGAAS